MFASAAELLLLLGDGSNPKPFSPKAVPGMVAWWRADQSINNPITLWTDLSGAGYQLIAPSAPLALESLGGRPAARFSGAVTSYLVATNAILATAITAKTQPFAMYLVWQLVGGTGVRAIWNTAANTGTSNPCALGELTGGNAFEYFRRNDAGSSVSSTGGSVTVGTNYVLRYFYDGTKITIRANTTTVVNNVTNDPINLISSQTRYALGCGLFGTGVFNPCNSRLAENIIYNTNVSALNDAKMSAYFFKRYGITN